MNEEQLAKRRAYTAEWRRNNLERVNEANRRYREKNREKYRELGRKNRQARLEADPVGYRKHQADYHKNRRQDPVRMSQIVIRNAKKRACQKGWDFDLDDYVEEIEARVIRGKCELSGINLVFGIGGKKHNSLSLDRKDSSKGYTYDNIRIIAWCLNCAFSDWGETDTLRLMKRAIDRIELI